MGMRRQFQEEVPEEEEDPRNLPFLGGLLYTIRGANLIEDRFLLA
jgi:hypothetical protein